MDSFEIIIGLKGTAYIMQDDIKYEVVPSSVLLLLPGHTHTGYRHSTGETSFYWLHFYCHGQNSILNRRDALDEISPLNSTPYFNKLNDSIMLPAFWQPESIEKSVILFKQLLHIANSDYYSSFCTDYSLTTLLLELSQQFIHASLNLNELPNTGGGNFNILLEWIRLNITEEFTIDELAEKFNYNKDYMSRMFKKHLGVSPRKYINGMKILKAKEYLCRFDLSIKEIAYKLGFKDEKYFMKLFKEYENLTPSTYRNAYYRTLYNNE
ncbi:AraC family transcriptional regulator [Kineothrix sedimenti]|uniref:AraC family transcriptional regulator n=1 Tax=Kineothrix sedimenti TaxID=3123317 RepID=A0ABZ3EUF8_9FIRM